MELQSSVQSSSQNENIVNTRKKKTTENQILNFSPREVLYMKF